MKKIIKIIIGLLIIAIIGLAIYMWKNEKDNTTSNINSSTNNVKDATSNINSSTNNVKDATSNIDEILINTMNSKERFVDKNNNEVLFKDFKIVENQTAVVDKYAFVDLDRDGTNELVVYTTSDYGAYIILHYQENKVYGYMIGVRSLENLKTDGSFTGSNGAASTEYDTISFDKNTYKIKTEAIYDTANNIYKINDMTVSEEKIKDYVSNWEKKQDVNWNK